MKRFLLLLKILHETWMSPSSTTWATDVILASACGLAHLIPLIPHLRTNLAFLLTGKRNNRKPSCHLALGDPTERERSQLCRGLVFLQGENLLATAWLSEKCSSVALQAVKVPQLPSRLALHSRAEGLPQPSETQPLTHQVARPQLCTANLPYSVPQAQTQAPDPRSPPDPPPSCPSQVKACTTTGPTRQQEAQSPVPVENQQLAWPLQTPPKPSGPKLPRAQEHSAQPTLNLPQGSQASQTPKSAHLLLGESNSPELQEPTELARVEGFWRDEHLPRPAFGIQTSQPGMQLLGKLPGKGQGQAQGKQGPPIPSAPAHQSSQGVQNIGSCSRGRALRKGTRAFQRGQPGDALQQALERDPQSSGRTSQKSLYKSLTKTHSEREIQCSQTNYPAETDPVMYLLQRPLMEIHTRRDLSDISQ
ncbi:hypothetical protein H920_11401 [Fukomys damarensis]|uniref:SPATA31 domain-containing protein n=1 Tax=Fukomys damarensis TaxID=885580 RepID=A0A091D9T3_FUKDA|nr:hypothetical protein H920_11401 [Fukomys damarensis]